MPFDSSWSAKQIDRLARVRYKTTLKHRDPWKYWAALRVSSLWKRQRDQPGSARPRHTHLTQWFDENWAGRQRNLLRNKVRAFERQTDPWAHWASKKLSTLYSRGRQIDMRIRVNQADLLDLVSNQGYRCALTGWELEPDEAYVDHIVPVSSGGTHTLDNLQVLHAQVNTAKGQIPQARFIDICEAVAAKAELDRYENLSHGQ